MPGGDPIPCRILDVSEEGAKLRPAWKGSLPSAFDLRDIFSDVHRAAVTVWVFERDWRPLPGGGLLRSEETDRLWKAKVEA
jgi:hypothetical protein